MCEHVAPSQQLTHLTLALLHPPLYGYTCMVYYTCFAQVIMVGFLVLESRGQRPYTFESAFAEYERRRSRNPGHNITKITKVGGSYVCVTLCVTVCDLCVGVVGCVVFCVLRLCVGVGKYSV